jgi:hypothetical protein
VGTSPAPAVRIRRPVFKTITLGKCRSAEEYIQTLKKLGIDFHSWVRDDLAKIPYAQEETDVDLVVGSPKQLNLKRAQYDPLCGEAVTTGLGLCPGEVAPALVIRLFYNQDLRRNDELFIAMEPIVDEDGGHHIFTVEQDPRGLKLDHHLCKGHILDDPIYSRERFVFVQPR